MHCEKHRRGSTRTAAIRYRGEAKGVLKTELVLPRGTVEKVKGVAEETLEGVARKVLSAALERRRSQGRMKG